MGAQRAQLLRDRRDPGEVSGLQPLKLLDQLLLALIEPPPARLAYHSGRSSGNRPDHPQQPLIKVRGFNIEPAPPALVKHWRHVAVSVSMSSISSVVVPRRSDR
jgi:hypothetical protein